MDLKDIKAIIDLMKKNSVSEFELEKQDFKIRLKRGGNGMGVVPIQTMEEGAVINYVAASPATALPGALPTVPTPAPLTNEAEIKSPMIGTFYRAPSPEAASYVEVGTEVSPDTVVCIIEAMKVMNEIKAECRGILRKVMVENASSVQYGQALFKVEPL